MIKNVIFDLGKVLIDYDFARLLTNFKINPGSIDFNDFISKLDLLGSGTIDKYEFARLMSKSYNLDYTFDDFEKHWCDLFFPMPEMESLILDVNDKYPTYILSNTDEMHFPYVMKHYDFLKHFKDRLMLSYELKSLKPDPKIYIE